MTPQHFPNAGSPTGQLRLHRILPGANRKIFTHCVKYAKGVYLYDYDDKRYIDFSSGLMNVNIGHGNQRITEAVVRQMQEVSYVTPYCVTKVRGELGKKLAEICPGDLNKAFFTLCGATSNEAAIKLARLYTGRHKNPKSLPILPRRYVWYVVGGW